MRPLSWFPLASFDPVPGDPDMVREAGQEYERVADLIQQAAADLREIAGGFDMCSEAVMVVQESALTVAASIDRARDRYAATGAALKGYAPVLEQAQSMSAEALNVAQGAVQTQTTAQADQLFWQRQLNAAEDPSRQTLCAARVARARALVLKCDDTLVTARQDLGAAIALRNDAAERARAEIHLAVQADGLADSMWTDLSSAVVGVGIALWDNLDTIAAVAGIAALVLAWVPVLGQALAAVALILGAVVLIKELIEVSQGDGSWFEVGVAALGLVTFGVGRVLGKGLKVAAENNRGLTGLRPRPSVVSPVGGSASGVTSRTAALREALSPTAIVRETGRDLKDAGRLLNPKNARQAWAEGWQDLATASKGSPFDGAFTAAGRGSPGRDAMLLMSQGTHRGLTWTTVGNTTADRLLTLNTGTEGRLLSWIPGALGFGPQEEPAAAAPGGSAGSPELYVAGPS